MDRSLGRDAVDPKPTVPQREGRHQPLWDINTVCMFTACSTQCVDVSKLSPVESVSGEQTCISADVILQSRPGAGKR